MIESALALASISTGLCEAARRELSELLGVYTRPHLTSSGVFLIGVGRRAGDKDMHTTVDRATVSDWLDEDLSRAVTRCDALYPEWRHLDLVRKRAVLYVVFYLGFYFKGSGRFVEYMRKGEWRKAGIILRSLTDFVRCPGASVILRMIHKGDV